MTNREMIGYLREELNENRHIVLYLNSLKDKMESLEDVNIIKREMDRLTDYIDVIKSEYHKLLEREMDAKYEYNEF